MLCAAENCTGCMACISACPYHAIKETIDNEGFTRPEIIDSLCRKCQICSKVCPQLTTVKRKPEYQDVYACWSKDTNIRRNSSSGGFFSEISKAIINEKGIIFGAAIENTNVIHLSIEKENELYKLQGSKYVQSKVTYIYNQVKEYLENGRKVLFSGTPCQIAGLYNFLSKEYDNLTTIDMVCHGVPSPKVYNSYIKYLENKTKSKVKGILFRDKDKSWTYFNIKVLFENGNVYKGGYFSDPYIIGFLKDIFLRPSCHHCTYANTNRISDITIADFWGYIPRKKEEQNDDKGISLIIINTKRGKAYLDKCSTSLSLYKRSIDEAISGNKCLSQSYPKPDNRNQFWKDYNSMNFDQIVEKYFYYDKKILFSQKIRSKYRHDAANSILFPFKVYCKLKNIVKGK